MINLAVIGDPIEHSLSPNVHTAALDAIGIGCCYKKIRVKKGGLKEFIAYAKENNIIGFNLTMPHKVDVLPFLSYMDIDAKRFNSVNTVKFMPDGLYGYNTDGEGYCRSLNAVKRSFCGSNVIILGSGGVVRTLALKAAFEGAKHIAIFNRTIKKAENIADMVCKASSSNISAFEFDINKLLPLCAECDILINATPLGMNGIKENFADLSFLNSLPDTALVSDLIYNPTETKLLKTAAGIGLDTLNGLGMLIYQALIADKIYTGKEFDMERVFDIVSAELKF